MADKMTGSNPKDMVYPQGSTGENVANMLTKTAFPSPTKLDNLKNADAMGKYDKSPMGK